MIRFCLRDELYLLAHKPNGVPLVLVPALSVALAAATLIDLQFSGHIVVVSDTRLRVATAFTQPDPIAAHALAYLAPAADGQDNETHRELRTAIGDLAREIYARTEQWNHVSGRVGRREQRRHWYSRRVDRFHQSVSAAQHVAYLQAMLYHATQVGHGNLTAADAALCTFVAMLRMERARIQANVSDATLQAQLRYPATTMVHGHGDAVRWLLTAAEERIGSVATAALR